VNLFIAATGSLAQDIEADIANLAGRFPAQSDLTIPGTRRGREGEEIHCRVNKVSG